MRDQFALFLACPRYQMTAIEPNVMLALAMAVVCTVVIATEFPGKKLEARAGVCYVYDVPAKQHLIGQNMDRRNQSSMYEVL